MNEKEFKQLVKKYHQDQLSPGEKMQLNDFERALLKKNASGVFKRKLHQDQVKADMLANISNGKSTLNWTKFITIAASFAILIGVGLGLLNLGNSIPNSDPSITVSTSNDIPKTILLEDGSKVVLNRQSQISYTKPFSGDQRRIELQGEAYFQVARDSERPFIVVTDQIDVEVLGTEFNVLQTDSIVAVTVSTGQVAVHHDQESVNLTSNEQVQFNRGSGIMSKSIINHQIYSLWKEQRIRLKNISMAEFAFALRQTHGVMIDFESEELANIKLTVNYDRQEPIEEIIKKMNYINDVKLTKTTEATTIVAKKN